MKKFLLYVSIILLLTAGIAAAADDESWLEFGGDYQLRYDNLKGTVANHSEYLSGKPVVGHDVWNDALFTNRYRLNMKTSPLEDISFKVRLTTFKIWGNQTTNVMNNLYFGMPGFMQPVFDGATGYVPGGSEVYVDQAYATWANVFDSPFWFSIGRRPSTNGAPTNIRVNTERIGTAGVPGNLIDSGFDGFTLGFAPEIESLPGFYIKYCGGKGMERGYANFSAIPKDTDFGGLMSTMIDTPALHIEGLIMYVKHMMSAPPDGMVVMGNLWNSNAEVGDVYWWGVTTIGKPVENLTLFGSIGQNFWDPSTNAKSDFKMGMLWNSTSGSPYGNPADGRHSGTGVYVGGRYDFKSTGTKLGLEFNNGTKYWMPYGAASNDMWTNKLNTRGQVYEAYIIQELNEKPVAKRGKAYFRLGYQYSNFVYTGSINWLEVPVKISDLTTTDTQGAGQQFLVPLKRTSDLYLTFEVLF